MPSTYTTTFTLYSLSINDFILYKLIQKRGKEWLILRDKRVLKYFKYIFFEGREKKPFTLTIFAGDGFGPRFAAGTNSWVEPARNRNNTLQCSCPATVSAFTETRTGPFSPSLPTRFTCSCERKRFVSTRPIFLFYDYDR